MKLLGGEMMIKFQPDNCFLLKSNVSKWIEYHKTIHALLSAGDSSQYSKLPINVSIIWLKIDKQTTFALNQIQWMKGEKDDRNLQNIWSRFLTGDQEAFAVLYNLHIDHLYHYGSKVCHDDEAVKDSLQELFLELFLKREKIKVNPENLKYYLLLALKRTLVKKIQSNRKKNRDIDHSIDFEPEYSIEFQIIERERDAEINSKVSDALRQLPAKQKEAIYLRFNAGLEYPEIASILEITVESVRKQVHRALKTIREILGNESHHILFSIFLKKS